MEKNETNENETNENETNIYQALAKFANDAPVIEKTQQNDFGNYKYPDFASIVKKCTPILTRHDIVIVQTLKGTGILTEAVHIPSMSKIESYCEIPQNITMKGQNAFQVYGSAITYFRRYQYCTICGLVADDDVDTKVAKTGKPKLSKERFKEAKIAYDKGEVTMDEIMAKFTLTQAQKLELTNKS